MELIDFISRIASSLTASVIVVLVVWLRKNIRERLAIIYHFTSAVLLRHSYVLIWNDDDIAHSKKISDILKRLFPSIRFKAISSPSEILSYPISNTIIRGIILISSDVTKLSEDKAVKDRIQNRLVKFVTRGGGLVGTHDIIYRRVRNDKLEAAFGCQMTEFRRIKGKVRYIRNPTMQNHALSRNLPNIFELNDGEVVWGSWSKDTVSIYSTEREHKPLVVAREYALGKIVWLNSGDKLSHISPSIALPEKEFILLIRNSLNWFSNGKLKEIPVGRTVIIAHRGAPTFAHENTIESFAKAIELGADMMEFDVRKTKDNVLIIHHDEFIGEYALSEMSYIEANRHAGKKEYRVPTLEEVLKLATDKIDIDVELKETGYELEVIEIILKYFKPARFVVTTFNDASIRRIKGSYPQVKVGLLLGKDKPKNVIITRLSELFPLKRCRMAGADFLAPHFKLLRFGFIGRVHRKNKPIFVWTVDDETLMTKLIHDSRIEAIITNRTDVALSFQREK